MDDNIVNLFVFSIPEAVLVLTVCLSFLDKKHSLMKTLAYCLCIFLFLTFLAPLLKLHMLFMIFYVLTSILAVKFLYKTDFVNTLISYSIAFAIYFAIENIYVQAVFALTKISPQEFMKLSLFKIGVFYILFAIILLISLFIRKKEIHIILDTSSVKVGE